MVMNEVPADAYELLMRFQWARLAMDGPDEAKWVEAKGKATLPRSEWRSGPLEASAREFAGYVQGELRKRAEPLERGEALELDVLRHLYLLALYELGRGSWRLAKSVEADAAGGQALAICLGTWGGTDARPPDELDDGTLDPKRAVIAVDRRGRAHAMKLGAYGGCLRTFPDPPYGSGRKWPSWCPECRPKKSNAKNKAIADLRRDMASFAGLDLRTH